MKNWILNSKIFIEEKQLLGTAGLNEIKNNVENSFFVTNCDILIDADYESIYNFTIMRRNDITLVASTKEYIIPYGTCELNEQGHLSNINEKPQYNFLVNTGLYVLDPKVLELIPSNKLYHITDLIEDVKRKGWRVGVFNSR